MALLDFKKGKITIKYKVDTSDTDATRVEKDCAKLTYGYLLGSSNTKTSYAS
jgi:hypothetical protein